MPNNILNPLEKELLIRLYRSNPDVKLSDFCRAINVSDAAFKTWLKKYDAEGLSGLYRSKRTPSILPEGIDETEENLRRELIRTRIELERLKKLHPDPERRWDVGSVRACIREEYAIVEALSKEFPVALLCGLCGVSRSGHYKWRKRGGDSTKDRARVLRLVRECHDAHPSHGYRWVHAYLKKNDGVEVSAEYIRRCFLYLAIRAETKHQKKSRGRKVRDPYPNLVFSTWETVDRPRQVVVSDMTAFWTRSGYWELALYFDVFTKQIIGRELTKRRGWPGIYHDGLEQAKEEIEKSKVEAVGKLEAGSGGTCVLHTDQGSVYASKAYNEIIRDGNIVRSCSRAGKPTDNPVNEPLNGWIKEGLFCDFGLYEKRDQEVEELVDDYVEWYNAKRPCWSLGYMTPNDFYDAFMAGQVERRDTFARRVLDPTPKFVREKLARAEAAAKAGGIGTSEELCFDATVYAPVSKSSSGVYERDADSGPRVHHCPREGEKNVHEA